MTTPPGKCQRCNQNNATHSWGGEHGDWALIRGLTMWLCERCVVEAQLAHAVERAQVIGPLRDRLAMLGGPFAKEPRE